MPPTVVTNTDTPVTTYDISLRLAPFLDASLKRTGSNTGIVTLVMDPRHASLQVDLLSLGVLQQDATAVTQAESAPTFSVVCAEQPAIAAAGTQAQREFAVVFNDTAKSDCIYVVGLEPDATDDNGVPTTASIKVYSQNTTKTGDTTKNTGGDTDDPQPIDVVIRKKRIPIPPGTGQSTSTGTIIVIAIVSFLVGYTVALLLA